MNVIERLVDKAKEFKKMSEHIASKYKVEEHNKPDNDALQKLAMKNAEITKELFEIVDEIESIEGKVRQ